MTECNCSRTTAEQAEELASLREQVRREQLYVQQAHDELAALRSQQAEPVGEVRLEDWGRPFNAMQVRIHFYKEVPPAGTKIYASPPQETETQGQTSSSGSCSASNGITADACEWRRDPHDESGAWETDCDNCFVINEGTPRENDMRFCTHCGKLLKEMKE